MTHGSTGAVERSDEHEPSDSERVDEDPCPSASARFRIEIDVFGRVVPKVVPADSDTRNPAK